MRSSGKIDYLELPATNLEASKAFFASVFGWSFLDYGPDYVAFADAGMDGGFYRSKSKVNTDIGSALVVLYARDLEQTLVQVEKAGGYIKRPIFVFPGGRRFHFCDPSGNEFAVWSDLPCANAKPG